MNIIVQNWDTGGACAWGVITPTRSVRTLLFLHYRSLPVQGRPISIGGMHLTADPGPPSVTEDHHARVHWEVWDQRLASHPDQRFRRYIVEGIKRGFRIGFDYSQRRPLRSAKWNMSSVRYYLEVIADYLVVECANEPIIGLFPSVHVSKFGLTPKKTPGEWRLIVDLAAPEGASVNDGVYEHLCSLRYASVEDALWFIARLGRGTLTAKVDVRKAYRNIPIYEPDRMLLGKWHGETTSILTLHCRSASDLPLRSLQL